MRRAFVLAWLAASVVLCGCQRHGAAAWLVEYEGETVSRASFEAYVQDLEARGGPLTPEVRDSLRKTFIEESVLAIEARRRGLLKAQASREQQDAAIRALLARQAEDVTVSEEEIAAEYARSGASLREPETITLSQILVRTSREALDLRDRLARRATPFEALARARSIGPEAAKGGLMGTFRRGELPEELEKSAWTLRPGATSGVVSSPLGFHILRLDARAEGRIESLDAAHAALRARLLAEKTDGKVRQFVAGLLARAKVNE